MINDSTEVFMLFVTKTFGVDEVLEKKV